MTPKSHASSRFQRAAKAEQTRLAREREKALIRLEDARARVRDAEGKLRSIEHRLTLVEAAAGPSERNHEPDDATGTRGRELRGAQIREVAVRVLADSPEGSSPIHYRRWLELLEAAGYVVAGKRPDAVFLSQVSRSPVVRQSTQAGIYYLDSNSTRTLRRRLEKLQSDLAAKLAESAAGPRNPEAVRSAQQGLVLELQRTQRALEEARRTFPEGASESDEEAA
jgi:hypothetical protein